MAIGQTAREGPTQELLIAVAFNDPRLLHLSRMRPTAHCSAGSRNGMTFSLHCVNSKAVTIVCIGIGVEIVD